MASENVPEFSKFVWGLGVCTDSIYILRHFIFKDRLRY